MKKAGLGIALGILAAAIAAVLAHAPLRGAALSVTPLPIPSASSAPKLLFVGDIMLDRGVALHAARYGDSSLFSGVSGLFAGQDAVIANLEGTITDEPSVSVSTTSPLVFTFDPRFAPLLHSLGITAVSLANNHALDFGAHGFAQTAAYLDAAGIAHFGSPKNTGKLSAVLLVRGRTVCLVGYHALFDPDLSAVAAETQSIKSGCDLTVAFAHWGVEYQHEPTAAQRQEAHALIDAGADVVIGSHPHVVEPVEVYDGRAIFYSLGNFMFDQDFSPQTERGLALALVLEPHALQFTLIPTAIMRAEASLAQGAAREAVLNDCIGAETPADVAQSIRASASFTLPRP